jgi:hypothetical protein
MSTTDRGFDPSECSPYHSMGTIWICNHRAKSGCPFALAFGHVHYCNNRSLHLTTRT